MQNEIPPEWLTQGFVFQESLLESVCTSKIGVVKLVVNISEMNLSIHHSINFTKPFESRYPEGLLCITLKDVVSLSLDRLPVYREAFFDNLGDSHLDNDPVAQAGPKTIVGVELLRDSRLLDQLGRHKPDFSHLSIGTMDSTIDVVFKRLALNPSFYPATARKRSIRI